MTSGRFTLLVIAAAVVALVAVIGLSIDLSGEDGGHRAAGTTTPTPTATTNEPVKGEHRRRELSEPRADPDLVRGDEDIALVRPRNLARALAVLERRRVRAEGSFDGLRIAPGRIDTEIRNSRQASDLQLRPDFSIPFSDEVDLPGSAQVIANGLRARDVDPRAPVRILRKIDERRRGSSATSDLDYMIVSRGRVDHEIGWSVFLKRGPRPRSWRAEGLRLALTPIG